jgi:hypothetical protein
VQINIPGLWRDEGNEPDIGDYLRNWAEIKYWVCIDALRLRREIVYASDRIALEDPDKQARDGEKQDPYDGADNEIARLAIDKEAEVKEADANFEAGQGWQINDGCRECEHKAGFDIAGWDICLETVRVIIT